MNNKNERFSFLFYLADRVAGPLMTATLVGCLIAGRLETSHMVLFSIGFGLFVFSYFHAIKSR